MISDPVSLPEIFAVTLMSSIFSIGGGNGPAAMIQDRWVTQGMLDPSLFSLALALGYLSPGPKAGFVAGAGYYLHGVLGAAMATLAIIIPACIGAAGINYAFDRMAPLIARVALPMTFVVAGMIAMTGWSMAVPMHLHPWEIGAMAAVAVLVGWRGIDPIIVILGSIAAGIAWWALG